MITKGWLAFFAMAVYWLLRPILTGFLFTSGALLALLVVKQFIF